MARSDEFFEQASALLGTRGLTVDEDLLEPWLTDWRGRYTGRAIALAQPENAGDLSKLVNLCAHFGIPIVPQGGNSGMSGGATPDASGDALLLSTRRMDTIQSIESGSSQVTCGAGVILQSLHEAAEEKGMRFPLTLGGKGSATIGGLISTNAGGTQVLRHGTMRAQILGLQAVMANGEIFDSLTPLKKDNRGFDLKQLLIGSEGTLGIVTAATLRLLPALATRRVMFVGLDRITGARSLLLHAQREVPDLLEGFEVMPRHTLESVLAHHPGTRDPLSAAHDWYALIELAADEAGRDRIDARTEAFLSGALESELLSDATIAANETQAEALWHLRDGISAAERALGPAMQHDISVPVEKMAEFVEYAQPEMERCFPGTTAVAFGHLGDGNVHFHVLAPSGAVRGEWEEGQGAAISRKVHDLVTEWGGSISAEHGIGQMKRSELGRLGDPASLFILRSVKKALDPNGLLNPGKLVPAEPA
ncbi:FAD-binding oxidoreductase [Altererythrobacter sp. MTPC7]|uniref:FAD-binding oxidoreductase n=1 Tax=Altererythrobacter sp. MTPC7 TaxID=3056567 RepID=UPI0036F1C6FB